MIGTNWLQIQDPHTWANPMVDGNQSKKLGNMEWLIGLIGTTILLGLLIIVATFLNDALSAFLFEIILERFHRMNPNP